MFSLMCAWTNGWATSSDAGDLRRYWAHYDVTVINSHGIVLLDKWVLLFHVDGFELPIMTSSHGSFSRVTGHFYGEFTGHRWIPLTKGQWCGLWCLFDVGPNKLLNKQSNDRWFETTSHGRHCNAVTWQFWGSIEIGNTFTRVCYLIQHHIAESILALEET